MLQINKKAKIIYCHYNFNFLFREKKLQSEFVLKQKKSQSITLRSPKHFNIGKHKVYSINTKALNIKYSFFKKLHFNCLFKKSILWTTLKKLIIKNTYVLPKTITVCLKTTFKLMWLEF